MTRDDVVTFLKSRGYASKELWPHLYYKELGDKTVRYRVTTHGLRLESRLSNGEWVRIRSAYFKNLSINPEGKLAGLTRKGM